MNKKTRKVRKQIPTNETIKEYNEICNETPKSKRVATGLKGGRVTEHRIFVTYVYIYIHKKENESLGRSNGIQRFLTYRSR